ncbi:MAG: hypothetical protein ACRDZY_07660 [Acidimicrobiales bacterium]
MRIDLTAFRPGGRVGATVDCVVSLSGAAVPGLPGSMTLSGASSGPVDPYRNATQ